MINMGSTPLASTKYINQQAGNFDSWSVFYIVCNLALLETLDVNCHT